MRIAVSFLIGCVFGATGALMYAAPGGSADVPAVERSNENPVSRPAIARPDAKPVYTKATVSMAGVMIPVEGIPADALQRNSFNEHRGTRTHEALDILAPRGTPVVAAVNGKVRKLFTSAAGGLTIYQYDEREEMVYYYAHLDRYADHIREGVSVRQGEVIGYVGVTGNAGNTPHLHFSISVLSPTKEWWKGTAVDPYPILSR
jgi:murein DD-endopeptidase MepM/ murein hydrolase activator NlpD